MRIKLNGTILESNNALVVEQWKKKGYKEYRGKMPRNSNKEPEDNGGESEDENFDKEPEKEPMSE